MCLLSTIPSCEIDRLLRALMEENPELQNEIEHLSRRWVAEVMSQPSKSNKDRPRSFDYSKSKIESVLKWRKNHGFLLAEVERRVELQGNPLQKTYLKEFNTSCFYWCVYFPLVVQSQKSILLDRYRVLQLLIKWISRSPLAFDFLLHVDEGMGQILTDVRTYGLERSCWDGKTLIYKRARPTQAS